MPYSGKCDKKTDNEMSRVRDIMQNEIKKWLIFMQGKIY